MVSQRQKLKERLKKAQKGELSNDELNADWIRFANPAAALEELRVFDEVEKMLRARKRKGEKPT